MITNGMKGYQVVGRRNAINVQTKGRLTSRTIYVLCLPSRCIMAFRMSTFVNFICNTRYVRGISNGSLNISNKVPSIKFRAANIHVTFICVPIFVVVYVNVIRGRFRVLKRVRRLRIKDVIHRFFHPYLLRASMTSTRVNLTLNGISGLLKHKIMNFQA